MTWAITNWLLLSAVWQAALCTIDWWLNIQQLRDSVLLLVGQALVLRGLKGIHRMWIRALYGAGYGYR